jgi:quinol monooxygenase YgiN
MDKIAMVVSIEAKAGRREAVRTLWDTHLRARVEASHAQELYLVVEDVEQPDTLHLIEVYNDPAEMQRNAAAPWFADYMKQVGPLLAGPPTMISGSPVWSKGLPT